MDEVIEAETPEEAMQILADRLEWKRDFYADEIKESEDGLK